MIGGLVAGLIINVGETILNVAVVGADFQRALTAAGVAESPHSVLIFSVSGFVFGIVALWIYASIRPRFGAGPKTALYAGLAVWILYSGGFAAFHLAVPFVPTKIALATLAWGSVELPLATLAGASLYKETSYGSSPPSPTS